MLVPQRAADTVAAMSSYLDPAAEALMVRLIAGVFRHDRVCPRTGAPLPADPDQCAETLLVPDARLLSWIHANWIGGPSAAPFTISDNTAVAVNSADGKDLAAFLTSLLNQAHTQLARSLR